MAKIKGFFMTADAMAMLSIVMLSIGMLSIGYSVEEGKAKSFQTAEQNMHDIATIALYLRQDAAQLGAGTSINPTAKYAKCTTELLPTEETSAFNTQPDFQKNNYCEEKA